jgi:cysteine desulfurase
MEKITYLDNAATTAIDPEVLAAMLPYLSTHYGNPSSSYSIGRQSKSIIEACRKQVAELLGVSPLTIFFTSGGTESNNTAIASSVRDLNCKHIITSPIEHHAVLKTVEYYCLREKITCSFVAINAAGEVDYTDLDAQLQAKKKEGITCLVSLMHANNEIGTLLDLPLAAEICKSYDAIFHSDCVQTIGHYKMDLSAQRLHFASASGHKFHGPKGTGILYANHTTGVKPLIYGGGQERNVRAGTENVAGIVGFTKALELSMQNYEKDNLYIRNLNLQMRNGLASEFPVMEFNTPEENSLYTVLNANLPSTVGDELLLIYLDNLGICVSSGSACSSGNDYRSHVIRALDKNNDGTTIRFSFSKQNSIADIDFAVGKISEIIKTQFA